MSFLLLNCCPCSALPRQLLSDKGVNLRFDGIRQSEDRTDSASIPKFSDVTADLISHNLLVYITLSQVIFKRGGSPKYIRNMIEHCRRKSKLNC